MSIGTLLAIFQEIFQWLFTSVNLYVSPVITSRIPSEHRPQFLPQSTEIRAGILWWDFTRNYKIPHETYLEIILRILPRISLRTYSVSPGISSVILFCFLLKVSLDSLRYYSRVFFKISVVSIAISSELLLVMH